MKKIIIALLISFNGFCCFGQPEEFIWDTISFDEQLPWYLNIDSSEQNIWQIGTPSKTLFDSAFSAPYSIVTDTINSYPPNNNSWFEVKIGEFNYEWWYPASVYMEIKHKFDTDTLVDGGFITVSWDDGLTWMNIIRDTIYWDETPGGFETENMYTENDTLYYGEFGFSGNSNGWITTSYSWHFYPVKAITMSDTMLVRFNFISDSIETNKEGWLIDNIRLFSVDFGSSIDEYSSSNFNLYPNPIDKTSTIDFKSVNNKIELEVFNNVGQRIYHKNHYNTKSIIFDKEGIKPGSYIIKIKTDDWIESKSVLIL